MADGLRATLFNLEVYDVGNGSTELVVRGDLDMVSAPELSGAFDSFAGHGKEVVIDLSAVTFLDSTGLRALWTLRQNITGRGRVLLRSPSPPVMRVLKTTKLDKVFDYVDDSTQADD